MARPSKLRSVARWARETTIRAYRPIHQLQGLLDDRQVVFILGHMRSGSSMLTHVLWSHPEIVGIGELHRQYADRKTLNDLTIWMQWYNRRKLKQARFVLDKLLHERLLPKPQLLRDLNIRCIFLTREPVSSIKSMAMRLKTLRFYQRPDLSAEYYDNRLRQLMEYADIIEHDQGVFLDYTDLVERTDASLALLSEWLGLKQPLSPHYENDPKAKPWSRSDSSEHIDKGVIYKAATEYDVELPPEMIERSRSVYDAATEHLRRKMRSL